MICRNCGKEFVSKLNQVHCSKTCYRRFQERKRKGKVFTDKRAEPVQFNCSQCGKAVSIEDYSDKRSRFCSMECEKKYWRHPPHENEHCNSNLFLGQIKAREKRVD